MAMTTIGRDTPSANSVTEECRLDIQRYDSIYLPSDKTFGIVLDKNNKTSIETINRIAAEIFTDLLPTKKMRGAEIDGKTNASRRTIDISGHLSNKALGNALGKRFQQLFIRSTHQILMHNNKERFKDCEFATSDIHSA